jgi:hypothetical protein
MSRECLCVPNVGTIPPELKKIPGIRKIDKWYAKPHLESDKTELEEVDAYTLLEPLLKEKSLIETLRMGDLLNGCLNQCDTCMADTSIPNKIFSFSSLTKLFEDKNFMEMLQPNHFRLGNHGDILNHPQALDIAEMILKKTQVLHRKSIFADNKWHMRGFDRNPAFVLYFNYRPQVEDKIDKLIDLAQKNEETQRMAICISLPLNVDDVFIRKFIDYAKDRKEIFNVTDRPSAKYPLINAKSEYSFAKRSINILIHNVADEKQEIRLSTYGRKLEDKTLHSLRPDKYYLNARDPLFYKERGLSYTYLNPDGLWLMVHVTGAESHTCEIWTPINNENINILNQIPCHYDSIKPPYWPGGIAKQTHNVTIKEHKKYLFKRRMDLIFGGKTKPPSIVKY